MKIKTLALILLLAGWLCLGASSDTAGPPMTPEFNREAHTMTIIVHVYEDHDQVTAAKRALRPQDRQQDLLGWSTFYDKDGYVCELHVARAHAYMDPEFRIWGHELAHCVYGNYHKELDAQ